MNFYYRKATYSFFNFSIILKPLNSVAKRQQCGYKESIKSPNTAGGCSADQLPLEDRFSEMSHTGPVGITIFLGYAKKLLNKFF